MVMRSLRVPEKLWERAKAKADREDLNISDVVREFLEEYVRDDGTVPPYRSVREAALAILEANQEEE
jgi:antitoxin component of RelBE/YafQ-DinJ toxin-antitoxin module